MGKRKIEFINGEIYHIFGRGVEGRPIFLDDKDRFRFIHDLYEFNDEELASNLYYKLTALESYNLHPYKPSHKRDILVEILAFCLMPNHYHLLLKQLKDNGIVRFMQKMGGYPKSFNLKYQRKGTLFQGRFGAIHVTEESHFIHLPVYIHLNPLDLVMPEWRSHRVADVEGALSYLESYRWSSHLDYLGNKNFPSVTSSDFVLDILGGKDRYIEAIKDWMSSPKLELIDNHLLSC